MLVEKDKEERSTILSNLMLQQTSPQVHNKNWLMFLPILNFRIMLLEPQKERLPWSAVA